jgi:hypothetical protein
MKHIIALALIAIVGTVHAEAVMQKVCHTDAKTKREVCKTIKTHKKVEGTAVPEKATATNKKAKK